MVWDCLIVGLFWLHHIKSLTNFTMATIARNDVYKESSELILPGTSSFDTVILWKPNFPTRV
jgi:hypothetical protein